MPKSPSIKSLLITTSILTAAIYLIIGSNYGLNVYDEAIGLYGAERVMQGDIPYKDFWTMYAPGQYYLLGAVSAEFGWTLMTERLLSITILLLMSITYLLISKKTGNWKSAIFAFFIIIAWSGAHPFYARAVPTALLFSGLCLYSAVYFLEFKKKKYLLFSGIAAGITIVFRHDTGIYLLIILSFFFLTGNFFRERDESPKVSIPWKMLIVWVGFIIAAAGPANYFLANVPFDKLYNQLFYVPSKIFPAYRALPFPDPLSFDRPGITGNIIGFWRGTVFYLPIIINVVSIVVLIYRKKNTGLKNSGYKGQAVFLLSLTGIVFYAQALVRSDTEHIYPSLVISAVVLSYYISEIKAFRSKFVYALVFIFLTSVPFVYKVREVMQSLNTESSFKFEYPRLKGLYTEKVWGEEFNGLIGFIEQNVAKREKIFVGSVRHDKIILNDIIIYYVTGRGAATGYHELHPGVATEKQVQEKIANDLVKNKVRYVILTQYKEINEPNLSSRHTGSTYLDSFIKENYKIIKIIGNFIILKKNSSQYVFPR